MVGLMGIPGVQPRVFISYARSDGEPFATKLRTFLEQQQIPLWQDRVNMEGGRDWWQQIVEALNTVEFMVMVMTPAALKSPIVRREWRYARQQGVCIYPIKAISDLDFKSLPKWMRDVHWYDLEHEQTKFLNDLNRTCEKRCVPFMAAELPDDFVPRPHEVVQIREKLLDEDRQEPIPVTVALRGAGGYGKTTLARAICHDELIQEVFKDGILWVTLGKQPDSIVRIINNLISIISHEKPMLDTLDATTSRLAELLADRDILIVIDDVWDFEQLEPFLQGGKRCARLITTRNERVLTSKVERINVDAMLPNEAVELLGIGLKDVITVRENRALKRLARRLGEWPLLLKLVHPILRERVKINQALLDAVIFIERKLDKQGLTAFDARNTQARSQAVAKTLSLSVEQLSQSDYERYKELAIFPENVDIPLVTLEKLWGITGKLDEIDIEDLCQNLYTASLLLNYDLATRTIRLHDVIRMYLRKNVENTLVSLNKCFLEAYQLSHWSALPSDDIYLWQHLATHLLDAECSKDLLATLRDGNYLANKTHLCRAYAVEADLNLVEQHNLSASFLLPLKRVFRGISHLLNQCTTLDELTSTLHCYLAHMPELSDVYATLEQKRSRPYLTPKYLFPDRPSQALIRTLVGHLSGVNYCMVSPLGDLIFSCSEDNTVKVWDVATGQERVTLEGHTGEVLGCAISPLGDRLVTFSNDKTLKIWDINTGSMYVTLEGHTERISGCAVSPSGDWIVSCSYDGTFKIWDSNTGRLRSTLQTNSLFVTACATCPSGEAIISCSLDGALKIWDINTGQLRETIEEQTEAETMYAISSSGDYIVSCSDEGILKIWDINTEQLRATIEEQTDYLNGCAVSSSGDYIVSRSGEGSFKVWDVNTGQEHSILKTGALLITGYAMNPSGDWIVSCSDDGTLKIWDVNSGKEHMAPKEHIDEVNACAVSPSGNWIVSCLYDGRLKVWDTQFGGREITTLPGHMDGVNKCAISPSEDWIASCSDDGTLKIWDMKTKQERFTLRGHTTLVTGCAISPLGDWIVSCSDDGTLKIWDVQTGQIRSTLQGHEKAVTGCAISPLGDWIVSCSADKTLKIWDVQTGQIRSTLQGHEKAVTGCVVSPLGDWIVSCSGDKTLKIWDVQTGQVRSTLQGHALAVRECAVSPSGDWIISCFADGVLELWDVRTGIVATTLRVGAPLQTCAFCPDGQHIIAGGDGGLYFLHLVS
jgi:WD40 repeat protein